MKFAKLRLQGFKSFVEPAELEIRDGLTGVVGPNGCGKSNLLEALRWVMGEGSARSLRAGSGGDGMDEVIFAGTAKRPRRDLAEVRLVLDNRARRAPAAWNGDDQLDVSRTIRRGEGSGYAVNGRDARLKDVQLLFADAATGAHSPALVGQGRVAAIIGARPQERRQLLEEAAGISGLNVRRREAEQRLRAADLNLARLDDLLQARETQAAQLRRQARAAARYRELSQSMRALETALLRREWVAAVEAAQQAERDLQAVEAALAGHVDAAARAATAQANAAAVLPEKRGRETAAAAILQRHGAARATLVAERSAAERRLLDLQAAIEAAIADQGREQARAADSANTKTRLEGELAAQRQAEAEAMAAEAPAALATGEAEQAATAGERQLAEAVEAHAALLAEGRSVRAQAEAARERAGRLAAERKRLQGELARLKTDGAASDLARGIEAAEAALHQASALLEAESAAILVAEREAQAARQAAAAVERAALAARSEVASLEAEAKALERLRQGRAGPADDSARRSLRVEPGYEIAVAAALGDDVGAALGAGAPMARHWLHIGRQPDDPELPPQAQPLRARLEAAPELARRLAQIGVVEAPPDAAAIAALKPGQALVALDGWLWRWDGLVRPPGGASTAVAESLARENRLADINASLPAPRARLERAETELREQQQRLAAAQQAERQARTNRAGAEREQERLSARLQGLRAARAQMEARQAAIRASVGRLAAEGESADAEAAQAAQAVAALADASALAGEVATARLGAERARALLAERRAQAAAIGRNRQEAAARIARLQRELQEWRQRDRDAEAADERLRERIDRLRAERAALVAEPDALAVRLRLLDEEIAVAEQHRQQAAEAILAAELALSELDRQARAAEGRVADAREARATTAAAAAAGREKLAELARQAVERFGCQPRDLEEGDDRPAAALAEALAAMERERERIGVVNLRADLELAEIEEQLARDRAERSELETAIHRLRGSIGTLNREGRARLMAAFTAVDGHFRDLFTTLFGGGAAELALVESDDPLASGLEIRAQPPGKKLQSLSLLSGGEQALTAIALVFALFRTNPAPICVLDEVDAPLDDANVERFTRLLAHMADSTETRFLVVTHNPVTMAAMHRLYGVTMGEPGVSQLVSVALKEAEALARD